MTWLKIVGGACCGSALTVAGLWAWAVWQWNRRR